MRSAADIAANRRITSAIIADNPTTVVLYRPTRTRTASGGFKDVPEIVVPELTIRMIDQSGSSQPANQTDRATDGAYQTIQWFLLAEWDANVKRNDLWYGDEDDFIVTQVFPPNGYELRATVLQKPGKREEI